jgi:zinc transport system substrate-binding protein
MKAFKTLLFILVGVVVFVQLYVVATDTNETKNQERKTVSVSSFTLGEVVRGIAQESVKVVNILPLGVDPHSFEPTPKLMAEIEKSDLVLYNGAGLEPWIDGFAFSNRAVDASAYVTLKELHVDEDEHKHEEGHEHHKEGCEHSGVDPHYWLDFKNMQKVALLVKEELTRLEPLNAEMHEKNAAKYIEMLEKLDAAYKQRLSSCKLNVVIINHNALGYLASNYGFEAEALSGLSPEHQPSPKDLTRIFREIKNQNISTIFFENFVSDKAIRAVANDAKVNIEVFQTLGNITADEAQKKLTYEDIMYANLEKLSKALVCD